MKKIIAITGSFNPVTVAHYKILSGAVEKYGEDVLNSTREFKK